MSTQPSRTEAGDIVRRFVEACNRGDRVVIARLLAEEATFTIWGDLAVSGTTSGRAAIVHEFMPAAWAMFAPNTLQLRVETLVADGDRVAAEVLAVGVTAAGDPYRNRYCMVFDVRAGAIHAVREYMDTAYAARVLGGSDVAAV